MTTEQQQILRELNMKDTDFSNKDIANAIEEVIKELNFEY